MVKGGLVEELIPQNTTVPTSRTKRFTTVRDNQTAVKILVLQGESEQAKDNELLAEFELTGLRAAKAGEVELEVTFEINADGIVSVHAKDMDTGKAQSIMVTASSGLTREEIERMTRSAEQHAVAQRSDEESQKVRQEVESAIARLEGLFPEVEAAFAGSDFGKDALSRAQNVIGVSREAVSRGDIHRMREQLEALERARRGLAGMLGKP